MPRADLGSKLRFGFIVFGILVAIEVVEYALGTMLKSGAWPYLLLLAMLGAWPIVQFFMHIRQLWRPKE